jgi:2-alkenal reductase
MVTAHTRRWLIGLLLLLVGCSYRQEVFHSQRDFTSTTALPAVPTAVSERLPRTPFPTRAAVTLLDATAAAPLAAIESQTMQLYQQTAPAVASIDILFSHPAINPGEAPRTMLISQGSGFLYDDQGHVVTNAHVVSDRNDYFVRFGNSHEITATVIGRDEASDIAVLALAQPVDIAPLQLSQRTPKTGMWVMTIGNPLGLRDTMTLGSISAVGRTLDGNPDTNILQTDAAVNPGSSGGVLIDVNGAVLGITTAIQSRSGSFEGIGYAIPADTIRRIVPLLIER